MLTTLNGIKSYNPCGNGWSKLLKSLDKTKADDEPLSLGYILKSNGIEDAVWALQVLDYKDECLFRADVAESVLHIFEERYPDDKRPREAINGIRKWHRGEITFESWAVDTAYAEAAYVADAYAADDAARQAKWDEIEQLFIKHFVEKAKDELCVKK